jgi:hypothetical protein
MLDPDVIPTDSDVALGFNDVGVRPIHASRLKPIGIIVEQ